MDTLRLLRRYFAASLSAQAQYPGTTFLMTFGAFAVTFIDIFAIAALFSRFGKVRGWSFGEVALFYGLVSISFAISDFLTRGFDVLGTEFIRTGNFDRVLLRPRSLAVQLIGYDFRLRCLGRMTQGLVVVAIASQALHFHWTPAALALAAWTVAGGVALFFGLLVLQATLSFWTIEGLEVANVLTYGGVQAAQFPLSLYAPWFRGFLTFVVPLGCVAYFPVVALLGRHDPLGAPDWFLPLSPIFGVVFLAASFWAWRFGVRRYTSTGS
ncbi:MAG TPA: ABC-2 family transporter protein [Caulobacteraceae bacterium]|jgi:ABC-2 type transport system permease protein|nr:ABC-2 family transporter protein [Caulobacteraceae bacterium]